MANTHFLVEDYAGVTVVTFTESSILDSRVITEMGEALYKLIDEQNKQQIVLDFVNVKLLSSQTIGILLTMRKKIAGIKGTLLCCGVRKDLMKLFMITNLDKQFHFYKDDAEALATLGVRVK